MSNRSLWAISLVLGLGAAAAVACGPDFPWQLLDHRSWTLDATPANSFAFEAQHLVKASDRLRAVETEPFASNPAGPSAWALGLTEAQAATERAMRTTPNADQAFERGAGLPDSVRLYVTGAVSFRNQDYARAAERFEASARLDGPPERALMAPFMAGRAYAAGAGTPDQAQSAFAEVRTRAAAGAPDPLGLAVASYGEEAQVLLREANRLKDLGHPLAPERAPVVGGLLADAAALYAEQAARQSNSGVQSLKIMARRLVRRWDELDATLNSSLVQRLTVAFVLARFDDIEDPGLTSDDVDPMIAPNLRRGRDHPPRDIVNLFEALERRGFDHADGLDRLAALAYRLGRYDLATTLTNRATGPLASWVAAKLALQRGDSAASVRLYAQAVRAFPASGDSADLSPESHDLLQGERAILTLTRGDYVDALEQLYPLAEQGQFVGDALYVAERVLTVDELKAFVDRKAPSKFKETLSNLLARRLVRTGHFDQALSYHKSEEPNLDAVPRTVGDYARSLKQARSAWLPVNRAQAAFEAAIIARDAGMEIMGTEAYPDCYAFEGRFESCLGQPGPGTELVTPGEVTRVAASAPAPNARFHYRYVAAEHATAAADQLPRRSQAFAAVLCQAADWMLQTGELERAQALYQRYVREGAVVPWAVHFGYDCPAPDFDAARFFWWHDTVRRARQFMRWHLSLPRLVVALAAGGALLWYARRRRAAGP